MPYTKNTPNCGLPQWESGDKPTRMDFNTAFADVDTHIVKKANTNDLENKADKLNTYTKADVDYRLNLKLDKADKSNTYTKADVDYRLNLKSDKAPQAKYSMVYTPLYKKHGDHSAYYFKIQENVCHVIIAAERTVSHITAGDIITTLPVGFRLSAGGVEVPCTCIGGGESKVSSLLMLANGQILAKETVTGYVVMFATFTFPTY